MFDAVRPWLGGERSLERLNASAGDLGIRTESGKPLRFVAPGAKHAYYETRVFETGQVETRPDSLHDWFNALAWLAFPRTKARINALHARELPRERGRRGPLRDLLTIFDEGGAIVVCEDHDLLSLLQSFSWKALFLDNRERVLAAMRVLVFGHAVLEKAVEPWPGVTCKAVILSGGDLDARAAQWLGSQKGDASPKLLHPLPVFGYPGWYDGQDAKFYGDKRYFRP